MNFTVKRSEWLRGEAGGSFLRRKADGKMCCLGFLALSCGATKDQIEGQRIPGTTQGFDWPADFFKSEALLQCTYPCCDIMRTNDDVMTSDSFKEEELVKQFAELGISISFED